MTRRDVRLAIGGVLRGDRVRSEECRHEPRQVLFLRQAPDRAQGLELVLDREPVPRLDFDRGHAEARELRDPRPRDLDQLVLAAGAQVADAEQDPATGRGDLLVRGPRQPPLELVRAAGAENGVSVGVDQARQMRRTRCRRTRADPRRRPGGAPPPRAGPPSCRSRLPRRPVSRRRRPRRSTAGRMSEPRGSTSCASPWTRSSSPRDACVPAASVTRRPSGSARLCRARSSAPPRSPRPHDGPRPGPGRW